MRTAAPRSAPALQATLLLIVAAAILLPELARASWPTSPYTLGTPIRTLAGSGVAIEAVQVADGAGGIFVVWRDERSGLSDLYAQHLNSAGVAQWPANGALVSNATGVQGVNGTNDIAAIADGSGGLLVAWSDNRNGGTTGNDIYTQRLDATGARMWGASDLAVCTAAASQSTPVMTGDGAGGAIIAWADTRAGNSDIYARRVLSNGSASWTANGNVICNLTSSQTNPVIVTNGAGGAILGWIDLRNSASTEQDIYAQAISSTGVVQWTANGKSVSQLDLPDDDLRAVSDGSNGVVFAWANAALGNTLVWLSRLNSSGTPLWSSDTQGIVASSDQSRISRGPQVARLADGTFGVVWIDDDPLVTADYDLRGQKFAAGGFGLWGPTGRPVLDSDNYEDFPQIQADGDGGFFVAAYIYQGFSPFTTAQHMNSAGAQLWGNQGSLLALYGQVQAPFGISPDGSGGIIIAYYDYGWSVGTFYNLFATHADAFGEMVDGRPFIDTIRDVAGDQGGAVVVEWVPSVFDGDPSKPVTRYTIWRKVPVNVVAAAAARFALQSARSPQPLALGSLRRIGTVDYPEYWEYVAESPAVGRAGYSFTAATTSDSSSAANWKTVFMISAERANGEYWDSPPDSGYSVDNLPPAAPAPFSGSYTGGTTQMSWGANGEADFAYYRLYRGVTSNFAPGPASLLGSLAQHQYTDSPGSPYYYKLTAVDVHDNESAAAVLLPSGTVGVETSPVLAFRVEPLTPSPMRAGAGALVRFSIPRSGSVSLGLYDTQGRRVLEVFEGELEAGEHDVRIGAGPGSAGRLTAGMYFLRLETADGARVRRAVVLD